MTKPRLYLAGPDVFLRGAGEAFAEMKRKCEAYGFEGVAPIDADVQAPIAPGFVKPLQARRLYEGNIKLLCSCDAVIANLTPFRGPGMDAGTAFEMGYAAALGLPIFGWSLDRSDYIVRVSAGNFEFQVTRDEDGSFRDGAGMQVEDFGLCDNLMPICAMDEVMGDRAAPYFAAALDQARQVLLG